MDKSTIVINNLTESIKLKQHLVSDKRIIDSIIKLSELIIDRYKNAGKVLFCGNGGSAADAQHMAAELSGRYYYDTPRIQECHISIGHSICELVERGIFPK